MSNNKDYQSNLIKMQHQIRNNAQEYNDFVNDLQKWTKDISQKDKKLQEGSGKKSYPPVRGTTTTESSTAQPTSATKAQPTTTTQLDPDEQAEKAKESGNDFFKKGDFNKAIEFYSKSLQFKQDAVVYSNRSQAFYKLSNFVESELDATRSISLNSSYVKSYMRRGMARRELKKYKDSKDDFEYARKLNPNHVETERELLKAIELLKKSEEGKANKIVIQEDDDEEEVMVKEKPTPLKQPTTPQPSVVAAVEKPKEEPAAVVVQTQTTPVVGVEKKTTASSPPPTPVVTEKEEEIEDLITTGASKNIKEMDKQPPKVQPKVSTTTATTTTTPPQTNEKPQVEKPTPVKQPEQKPVITNKEPLVIETVKVTVKPTIPQTAPKSFYEFEKQYKELKGEDFANYLKIIPATRLHSILHDSLSPEVLFAILLSIHKYLLGKPFNKENVEHGFELMKKIVDVNRFDMTIMFLESSEMQTVKAIFELFYQYGGIEPTSLDSLRSKYIE